MAVPPTLPLTSERTGVGRSGPSGSATHTGLHAQGRVAVRLTLPLDVERTETVRLGPSGSATHTVLYAQARVAVQVEVTFRPCGRCVNGGMRLAGACFGSRLRTTLSQAGIPLQTGRFLGWSS